MISKSIKQRKQKSDRISILVIEPNADNWLIIRAVLAQCFPEVTPLWLNHSGQAKTYLTKLNDQEAILPRMILMELYLPDRQEGLSLLEFISSNAHCQHIPAIVVSNSSNADDIAAAHRFNIASYMVKPATYYGWRKYVQSLRRYWVSSLIDTTKHPIQ